MQNRVITGEAIVRFKTLIKEFIPYINIRGIQTGSIFVTKTGKHDFEKLTANTVNQSENHVDT